MVTVEAAFAIAAVSVVLMVCLGGLAALSLQLRCVDAAREAARLAARGDRNAASLAVGRLAPPDAVLDLHRDGPLVTATVTARAAPLPMITVHGSAVAAAEPDAQ